MVDIQTPPHFVNGSIMIFPSTKSTTQSEPFLDIDTDFDALRPHPRRHAILALFKRPANHARFPFATLFIYPMFIFPAMQKTSLQSHSNTKLLRGINSEKRRFMRISRISYLLSPGPTQNTLLGTGYFIFSINVHIATAPSLNNVPMSLGYRSLSR